MSGEEILKDCFEIAASIPDEKLDEEKVSSFMEKQDIPQAMKAIFILIMKVERNRRATK